jgi:tRNA A-37 threonylcarbamoyl transferase component Bud32
MGSGDVGRVFVSYRRDETRHLVGRLGDRLADEFGAGHVFVDVDSIPAGVDFAETIERELSTCAVLLAVIGPGWIDALDERGRRRLEDPDDFVVLEIQTALERGVRVIPVLVDGARMPRRDELPDQLATFARRNAIRLDHDTFRSDLSNLLTQLKAVVDEPRREAPRPAAAPRLLADRYELGETLGHGGMSEVHRGRDVRLGRDVAVKVLRADLVRDPLFRERFRQEATNAARLNHPAMVAVYDTGETPSDYGPEPFIVMEYVAGRTLREIVRTEGPLPGQRVVEIMADVCATLDFGHRHGIVHRDLKPGNVMITLTGAVKVMDFGLPRVISTGETVTPVAVIGTAQYLSPEQARGEAVDARSDVYAAGCVLFELLTGEPPFTGDSPVAVAYQHVREDPRPPSALNPRVNPALDAVVLKAMMKHPADRYVSAAEMRADLVRVLSGERPLALAYPANHGLDPGSGQDGPGSRPRRWFKGTGR